jgi:hypothetical protein
MSHTSIPLVVEPNDIQYNIRREFSTANLCEQPPVPQKKAPPEKVAPHFFVR